MEKQNEQSGNFNENRPQNDSSNRENSNRDQQENNQWSQKNEPDHSTQIQGNQFSGTSVNSPSGSQESDFSGQSSQNTDRSTSQESGLNDFSRQQQQSDADYASQAGRSERGGSPTNRTNSLRDGEDPNQVANREDENEQINPSSTPNNSQ